MPAGRPRKPFTSEDLDKVINMIRIQCTAEEISDVLGMDAKTLDRNLKEAGYANFSDCYKKHSSEGKASLRRMQWKGAQDGNVTMQIWLGKQMLGQRDKKEIDHFSSDGSMSSKPAIDASKLSDDVIKAVIDAKTSHDIDG